MQRTSRSAAAHPRSWHALALVLAALSLAPFVPFACSGQLKSGASGADGATTHDLLAKGTAPSPLDGLALDTRLDAALDARLDGSDSGSADAGALFDTNSDLQQPTAKSGIVPNSVDQIWEDMNGKNTGWVSNMPSGFLQFQGPTASNMATTTGWNILNIWIEIEAAGDGSSCSDDINKATHTRVEFGWTRGYVLRKSTNRWEKFTESKTQIGSAHGAPGPNMKFPRPCGKTYGSNVGLDRIEPSGFRSIYPKGYWRWHGWSPQQRIANPHDVKAVYGQCYMRLIKDDPKGPDDRKLARFVAHISSDYRMDSRYIGDIGISRYKTVTNNWVSFNFLTKMSKKELVANPPPFTLTPQ